MPEPQIPYIPEKLLFIYHTDTLDANISRLMEQSHRSSEPVPRLSFLTTYNQHGGHFLVPQKISLRSTRTPIQMRRTKYSPESSDATSGFKWIRVGKMPEAVGEVFVNADYSVAALNILVPIFGTIDFPGYIHTLNNDISIQMPENSDLEVIASAREGVFDDGERIRNKPVLSFEEYFWRPTTKARQLHRVFDTKKNPSVQLDEIRQRNRLYLLADEGKITITRF